MKKGFTLIEVLLVISLISMLGVFASMFYSGFYLKSAASTASSQLAAELHKAQVYSMASKWGSGWGVAYTGGNIVLYAGNSYASRNAVMDESYSVPSSISIANFTEVDFARVTGYPSAIVTAVITGAGTSYQVAVQPQGIIMAGVPGAAGNINSVPTLTSISPTSTAAGSTDTTITVTGSNFVSGAIINWNGTPLTTTYVSATSLTATVPAANITSAGTASVTVTNPAPGGGTSGAQTFTITTAVFASLAIDANVAASSTNGTPITGTFSTSQSNELLIAFISSDRDTNPSTVISGGGLSWSLVVQKTSGSYGDVEIWKAIAPSPLSNVTVSATTTGGSYGQTLLNVVAFKNASGIGATATSISATGAPASTLTTTADNAWVWGVGEDWTTTVARTVGPNQTISAEMTNGADGGSDQWTQYQNSTTPTAGTPVTLNDTAPTGDTSMWALVEIQPHSSAPSANTAPSAPSQDSPLNGATGIGATPVLTMTATDPNGDALRYKVTIYSNSICTTAVQTDSETASQTGWSGQNASSSSAFTSGTQGTYTVQTALSAGTTYYWTASA
ncbi:MAG: prepilin-type N-terminal cleavage/methylation domain-containing protein, partial [Chthoniobacter sp.]|nr:prepilin-type N-terminal cleavage/methylation domain-containing protein [Chthoniobacter sp.]